MHVRVVHASCMSGSDVGPHYRRKASGTPCHYPTDPLPPKKSPVLVRSWAPQGSRRYDRILTSEGSTCILKSLEQDRAYLARLAVHSWPRPLFGKLTVVKKQKTFPYKPYSAPAVVSGASCQNVCRHLPVFKYYR